MTLSIQIAKFEFRQYHYWEPFTKFDPHQNYPLYSKAYNILRIKRIIIDKPHIRGACRACTGDSKCPN